MDNTETLIRDVDDFDDPDDDISLRWLCLRRLIRCWCPASADIVTLLRSIISVRALYDGCREKWTYSVAEMRVCDVSFYVNKPLVLNDRCISGRSEWFVFYKPHVSYNSCTSIAYAWVSFHREGFGTAVLNVLCVLRTKYIN